MKRQITISAVFAVFLFVASYFFVSVYNEYRQVYEKLQTEKVELRLLRQQKQDMEHKQKIVMRINKFVDDASAVGLNSDRWTYYAVKIEEPLTFLATERILMQTANTPSYFFKPAVISLTTDLASYNKAMQKGTPRQAASRETIKKGDIVVELKGAFLVKKE
jgi:hypothetical protein